MRNRLSFVLLITYVTLRWDLPLDRRLHGMKVWYARQVFRATYGAARGGCRKRTVRRECSGYVPRVEMKKLDIFVSAAGLALFIWLASTIGWTDTVQKLSSARMAVLALLLLSLLRLALQTHSWRTALRAEGIQARPSELVGIRLAAQSIGYLSVLGLAASEPMKLRLLRNHQGRATTATLADTSVYGFSSALFGTAGCVSAGLVMTRGLGGASLTAMAAIFVLGLVVAAYPKPLLSPLVRLLAARCPAWLARAEEIETAIRRFGAQHQTSIRRMFWLDLGCQLLAAGEVVAVFVALRIPLHASTILALEAASRAVKMIASWMPARIGADETGAVAAFAAFGLPSSSALALALARRARDLLACAIGLGWLIWRYGQSGNTHRS